MKENFEYESSKEMEAAKANIMRDIGNRLTQLRTEHGRLTQNEFLRCFVGTAPNRDTTLSKYENGNFGSIISNWVCFMVHLHNKWGVDLNWLLVGDDAPVIHLPSEVQQAIATLKEFEHNCQFHNKDF